MARTDIVTKSLLAEHEKLRTELEGSYPGSKTFWTLHSNATKVADQIYLIATILLFERIGTGRAKGWTEEKRKVARGLLCGYLELCGSEDSEVVLKELTGLESASDVSSVNKALEETTEKFKSHLEGLDSLRKGLKANENE